MDVKNFPDAEIGEDLYSQETDFSLVPPDNYVPQVPEPVRRSSVQLNLIPDDSDYWHRIRLPLGSGDDGPAGRIYEDCVRLCGSKFAGHPNGEPAAGWTAVAKLTLRELSPGRTSSIRDQENGRSTGPSSTASPSPSHFHMASSSVPDRQFLNSSLDVEPVELLSRLKSASASQSPSRSPAVIRVSDSRAPSISPKGPSRVNETTIVPSPGLPPEVQINSIEQEGRILARIADLRKQGRWEDSRIPKCVVAEPFSRGIRNFTKEVTWVATLIAKEKKAKIAMAKKIAYAAKKWHERKAEKIRKLEREEEQRLRKTAKQIGSLVHAWWLELSKVAQLKQKEEIEIRKKGIRDLHLRHLMDQTEEFSTRMARGLAKSASQASFTVGESVDAELTEDPTDVEYSHAEEESFEDEEDTISDEEEKESAEDNQMDTKLLEDEANIPLEDLLPPEYRELLLAQSTDEPSPTKRKRTSSRTLSSDVYELEPKQKKTKDDDLSVLVSLPADSDLENASSSQGSAMFDEKIKSHEAALEKLKPKGNSLSSTEVVTKVPFLLRGNLREYQHVGLDWLVSLYKNKMNGILADEMGLGKTIQTIAHIAHLASEEGDWGPHLIIVPTSVLLNWELEFKRWCPGLIIKTYYGSRKQRLELRTGWTKPDSFHICITSYKVATQDYSSFRRMKWHYLILDEAQAIKNYRSQRWMRIAEFPSQRRLLLTGTPMQNSLEEVWALLHFLAPELFESLNMFQQLFSNLTAMSEGRKPQDQAIVKQLHTVLRPFILRRLKSEVETQLPKKYEQVLKCRLSKRQRYLYDDYMSRSKTKETLKTGNYLSVINILMQLRKVCNHPNLFEERPVLSPLVVHPLTVTLPSLVFDVLYRDSSDTPFFREVSTVFKAPFSCAQSNLTSVESSRLEELLPSDDKLILAADSSKEMAVLRPLPTDFSALFDVLEFSMVDLMAGTPFVMDDDRLCNSGCKHPPPPPIKAYSTVATVHMGRAKRSARKKSERKNGLMVDALTNGAKKAKTSHVESDLGRITTKYFAEELLPSRFRMQREDHCEILVAMNRQKCLMKPLLAGNIVDLITLRGGDEASPSFVSGYLRCRRAQGESSRSLPFQKDLTGLSGLTEMGSSVLKRIEQPEERYWIEHGSVALMPVLAPPPVLEVRNMPSSVEGRMNSVRETLMPVLRDVSRTLHPVERLRVMKFPETRLIQYDCGKLQKLDDLLRDRFAGGHRCLIFTQMTRVLDILEIFLTYHGYKYLRLDGSTGIELRQTLMDRFNRDTRYFCFILSTRSGGVGVNLTGADTVIFYDSDWNPTMDAQAQDRCHRIGQTRDVNIYRLISEYTVEENIFQKASQKRILGHLAIESGGFTTAVLKRENFKEIFGLKEDEVLGEMPETASEATFESAIAKVEDADDVEAAKKAKTEAAVENEDEEDDDDDDTPKFKAIQSYLTPIQCLGLKYLEENVMNQEVMEELEQTREEVERRKKEWELSRLENARAEKARAEEEANDPFLVSRSLMDPKFYHNLLTLEHPEECQDVDMPMFDFREASPSSDKENDAEMYITDFAKWGSLYRNPAPELAIPSAKSKSKSGKKRKDRLAPDSLLGAKSSRRKKEQQTNFEAAVGRGTRLPPHMSMSREFPTAIEMPDTLAGLEAISNDWKSFEDWQIVMTAATLQGVTQNPQQTLPCVTPISCELVSYVTSTVNAKYRQARDCQVRLRTLRMREEKDSSLDVTAPPKKKKKTKAEENLPVDKSPFPVPKRAVLSLQEDNGRARTQIYKDVFTAFRSQSYNPPIQRRDATYRAGAGAWSNAVFQDMNIALDDPVTPLGMLRRRQERSTVSKNFLNETAIRWAQTLGVTVDAHGQRADTQLLSPAQKSASILQQTLQAAGGIARTQGNATGQVLPSALSGGPQTPLPSPQFIAMNPNTPRRPVQFPGTSSPSPAPPPSSPLPSIGSTSLTQFIGGNAAGGGAPVVKIAPSGANVNVVNAVAGDGSQPAAAAAKSPAQLSQQRAQQMAMLRQIFALPPGQGTYGPQDIAKIKEFLSARGIQFSDTQLADLARAFANKTAGAVADGAGVTSLHQAGQQQLSLQLVAGGNQGVQVGSNVSVASPVPITSGPRPMTLNRVVRFPPGVQASGQPTTFSLNFVNQNQLQPQNPQTVRPQAQNQARRTTTTLVPNKNGPVAQVLPQQGKPVTSSGGGVPTSAGPVTILPGPPRTASIPNMTVNAAQMQQLLAIAPSGNHVVQTAQGNMQLRRNVHPGTVVIPMNVTQASSTPQPTQTLHVQAVQLQPVVEGKVPDVVVRDATAAPPAATSGGLPEPN